jgi:hypothetical protein
MHDIEKETLSLIIRFSVGSISKQDLKTGEGNAQRECPKGKTLWLASFRAFTARFEHRVRCKFRKRVLIKAK